jgi:hypothetical protein
MLQVLPDGKLLVVDGLLPPECCCDCTGKEPTADFSFTQTDDDPCTFDFFDESTAHVDCGDIVEWLWEYWDGDEWIEFSTEQNPTGVELPGEGPWDVRLTSTDECGCRDAGVMEVTCEAVCDPDGCHGDECCDELGCLCTDATIPATVTMTPSGIVGNCVTMNGISTVLTRVPGLCEYAGAQSYELFPGSGTVTGTWTFSFSCNRSRLCFDQTAGPSGLLARDVAFEKDLTGECGHSVIGGDCSTLRVVFGDGIGDVSATGCVENLGCYTNSPGVTGACTTCLDNAEFEVVA